MEEGGNLARTIPTSNPDPDQEQGGLGTVLIIKGVRESTLSVGKSRARNPTQNPTQNPTPNRPEPGRTIQRLRTAPCPQTRRSARDAWRAHGPSSEDTAHTPRITVLISEIKKKNQN